MAQNRIELLGVPVDCITRQQALNNIEDMLRGSSPEMVIAVNPEKVMTARQNPALLNLLHRTRLLIPDGIGVVFAGRILGKGHLERVPGSELMPMICELAAQRGYSIFLFGASPEVNEEAANNLRKRFPGICIAGRQHGHLQKKEMYTVVKQINDSKADILFVALGSPLQEDWMEQHLLNLNIKVCQGVGGTFDVLAGRVRRAPKFFRMIHLEWFYRLLSHPSRVSRQLSLPKFAFQILKQKVLQ